jgi:hypothetical protein
MTQGDIIEAIGSDDDEAVRRLFCEMAWTRTRRLCGLGPEDAPFSPYEASHEQLTMLLAELRRLKRVLNDETQSWR